MPSNCPCYVTVVAALGHSFIASLDHFRQVFTSWYNLVFLGHENIALESKVLICRSSKGAVVMGATSGD